MKKNVILLVISFAIVYIISNVEITRGGDATDALVKNVAEKIIRFHVIANSDSKEDQELKLLVKDAVVRYAQSVLKDSKSAAQTRRIMDENKEEILSVARKIIAENGYDYSVSMNYENSYFPVKAYGDLTFPAGYYNSVTIRIGSSLGKNWWCVLYPPLCFVDAVHGIVPEDSKQQLRELLGYRDYQALIYGIHDDSYKVSYRFRILTFLN